MSNPNYQCAKVSRTERALLAKHLQETEYDKIKREAKQIMARAIKRGQAKYAHSLICNAPL